MRQRRPPRRNEVLMMYRLFGTPLVFLISLTSASSASHSRQSSSSSLVAILKLT